MAAAPAQSARLTAVMAVTVAVVLALLAPTGPWQPASMILGWGAVVAVALAVAVGMPGLLATGAVLMVVRTGIHGLAGDRVPGLVFSAVLLLVMFELALISFEARVIPVHLPSAMGRVGALAVVAGVVVASVSSLAVAGLDPGPGGSLVALAAALAAGLAVFWLIRRPTRR